MPSSATSDAAKHPAIAFPASVSVSSLLMTPWLDVQTTVRNLFRPPPAAGASALAELPLPATNEPDSPAPLSATTRVLPPVPAFIAAYSRTLDAAWQSHDWSDVVLLVETLRRCWRENRQVFLCGNGGSAANAIHLANDFLYGIDQASGRGLRVTALPANAAVLTCLANDIAYEDIFAQQLSVLANPGDVLIALSGSGNSPNILKALARARELGVTSFAILGFSGGRALELAAHPIHFPVPDMQVAEDLQMMVGHMAMQSLASSRRRERVP